MKAISAKPTLTLCQKTILVAADNYGGKELGLITVLKYKGRKRGHPVAGIASLIVVVIKKGKPEVRKKVEHAVIIRTKKEYRRADGMRIKFEDNSAVVCKDEKGNPKGTIFKGPIAKEVCERWPAIAKVARIVV